MSLGDLGISTINGGAIGVKNAIINGNFQVNQRAVSGTVNLAAGVYGHDRWKAGASGCTYTFATVNNVTTLTISAGSLIQVIESLNLFDGTYTLSWTGTAQGKIGAGSYAGSGVTGAATGGTDLNIEFNTGTVSLVQFEQGSVATPFERRPYGTELALCQRYYYQTQFISGSDHTYGTGFNVSTTVAEFMTPFPVPMRTRPTSLAVVTANRFEVRHGATAALVSAIAITRSTPTQAVSRATTTGLTAGQGSMIAGHTTINHSLAWSTEL